MEGIPFRLLFFKGGDNNVTIQEAIDLADQLKPNMMITPVKIRFLNEIEGKIHEEIILQHEHTETEGVKPEYNTGTNPGTDLIVPAPYDMVYVYWLIAQIDHMNMEMDKYNNDRLLFEDAYGNFSDYWTRTRMPIPKMRRFQL